MPKPPRPEILAAVEATTKAFRARGRPLTPDATDDLARAWLDHWHWIQSEGGQEVAVTIWAALELHHLHQHEPGSAFAVLGRVLERAPGEWAEFIVFEELQALVEYQPEFTASALPDFLQAHVGLRRRLNAMRGRGHRPYGWTPERWDRLCAYITTA